MALFGTSFPKMVSVSGNVTANFEHSLIETEWVEPNIIEHKSVVTGARNYLTSESDGFGDYSNFTVTLYLSKYDSPAIKFNEIYAFNHTDVYFYPHSDGNPVRDSSNNNVVFHITDMKLNYLDTPDFKDVLVVTFKSKKYTNLANSLA